MLEVQSDPWFVVYNHLTGKLYSLPDTDFLLPHIFLPSQTM